MIYIGQNTISDIRLGNNPISAIYHGLSKIWPTVPPVADEFITVELVSGNDVLLQLATTGTPTSSVLQGSYDGTNWFTVTPNDYEVQLDSTHDRVFLKGNLQGASINDYNTINCIDDGMIKISGDMRYLVGGTSSTIPAVGSYTFFNLFMNNSCVYDCSEMILPWTDIKAATRGMFRGCSNMVYGPALPATQGAANSYYYTFLNCTKLESLGLPGTDSYNTIALTKLLSNTCRQTFYNCNNIGDIYIKATSVTGANALSGTFGSNAGRVSRPTIHVTQEVADNITDWSFYVSVVVDQ